MENSSLLSGRDERKLNPFSVTFYFLVKIYLFFLWFSMASDVSLGKDCFLTFLPTVFSVLFIHTSRNGEMVLAANTLQSSFFFPLIWGAWVGLLQLLGNKAVFKAR